MTTHQMKLAKEPFDKIANGQKIIESRLYDEKRQQINISDSIEFFQNDDPSKKIETSVKALHRYGTFAELFSDFPPAYFGGKTKDALLEEIRSFYPPEEESHFGVLGILIGKK